MDRKMRKIKEGVVIKEVAEKTVVVQVESVFSHKKYGKVVKTYKKFLVHDDKKEATIGDLVEIMETRPISKRKFYRIVRILGKVKLKIRELPKKKEKTKEKEEKENDSIRD